MSTAFPRTLLFLALFSQFFSSVLPSPASAYQPTSPLSPAQIPPYTIEAILVFTDPVAGTIEYSFRGHAYDDPLVWAWWSVGDGNEPDLDDPVKTLDTWNSGGINFPAPDAALTRGGTGLAVWNDLQDGPLTCNGSFAIPRGRIRYAELSARLLPEEPAFWYDPAEAAAGGDYTVFTGSSVALDVTGRGILIWREFELGFDVDGCLNGVVTSRTRYRVWDGEAWLGNPVGELIPGSQQAHAGLPFFLLGTATDIAFTSVQLEPPEIGDPPQTRQQALAAWMDSAGTDSQLCPGSPPYTVFVDEAWPRYSSWDGYTFSATAVIPDDPGSVQGPPFRLSPQHYKIGLAGDRENGADLVFPSLRLDNACGGPPSEEVWTAAWNGVAETWQAAFSIAEGQGADVAQEPDDVAVAAYGGGVNIRRETTPGNWAAEVVVEAGAFPVLPGIASLPHDRTLLVWTDATPDSNLRWSEDSGPGWSAPANLVTNARNPELAARPLARWAFLVYVSADNNLDNAINADLDEMEMVGSGPELAVVVQIDDRNGSVPRGDGTFSDGTFRAQIIEHHPAGAASAEPPDEIDIPEPNMGASATLSAFLTWAKEQYPADKFALVMWGHGDGWRGSMPDDSANDGVGNPGHIDDHLGIDELSAGLAPFTAGLELIAFDACLMAELEVALQVWDFADVMVASQDCINATGYPYAPILQDLELNSFWDGEDFSSDLVAHYAEYYLGIGVTDYTLSAVRLDAGLIALRNTVSLLGSSLALGLEDVNQRLDPADNVQQGLLIARLASHEPTLSCGKLPGSGCATHDPVVDLLDLALKIQNEARIDPAYKPAAAAVPAQLAAVVINEVSGPDHGAGANGLSIYFPQHQSTTAPPFVNYYFDRRQHMDTLYAPNPEWDAVDGLPAPLNHPYPAQGAFRFPAETLWDELLFRYYRPVADAGPLAVAPVGGDALLRAWGSSDSDGAPTTFTWDFFPASNDDATDSDRDGVNEPDDDSNATGDTALFPCVQFGVFPVRLTVRDDHESLSAHTQHYNSDSDTTAVICTDAHTLYLPLGYH